MNIPLVGRSKRHDIATNEAIDANFDQVFKDVRAIVDALKKYRVDLSSPADVVNNPLTTAALVLTDASSVIEVFLTAPLPSLSLPIYTTFLDLANASRPAEIAAFDTHTAGAGLVTIVAAPPSGRTRVVPLMTIMNPNVGGVICTVQLTRAGVPRVLRSGTIAPGQTWQFAGAGFSSIG